MQTILGSGGAIGVDLAKALVAYTKNIRLVSRNPEKVNSTDILFPADLTKAEEVDRSIAGSEIVYVTVGFEYKIGVWRKYWPPFIKQVLASCKKYRVKLVFFDNIYMYDPAYLDCMTEDTPIKPVSKKGEVRAEIAEMVLNEVEKGNVEALIARSADFYGGKNSLLTEMVFYNLVNGKKAYWFGRVNKIHTFTYSPDAARATAILGNSPGSYNQVWHLPTTDKMFTAKDWIELVADELGKKPRYTLMSAATINFLGLFFPLLKEFKEILYQYKQDYIFDSSKFEKAFDYHPVTPEEGVMAFVSNLKQSKSTLL